jgi:hypothetical protein
MLGRHSHLAYNYVCPSYHQYDSCADLDCVVVSEIKVSEGTHVRNERGKVAFSGAVELSAVLSAFSGMPHMNSAAVAMTSSMLAFGTRTGDIALYRFA